MAFHRSHGKDQSNKKQDLLPLFTLHDFMFSEKKMKKLMKSIEDSFEYTQITDEFEQIHNTPEKIMKYADTIVAEIERKERLLSKSCTHAPPVSANLSPLHLLSLALVTLLDTLWEEFGSLLPLSRPSQPPPVTPPNSSQ
jgi:hypothetical protein